MITTRRPVYINSRAHLRDGTLAPDELVEGFYQQLPGYRRTTLHSLDQLAKKLGVGAIFLNDDSLRFGIPNPDIAGAWWAVFRSISSRLGLSFDISLENLQQIATEHNLKLYSATTGHFGWAIAHIGDILGLSTEIHVPEDALCTAQELLHLVGTTVVTSPGGLLSAVHQAELASRRDGGIFIPEFDVENYQEVGQWIVDGHSAMMCDIDRQLLKPADLVITPTGTGALAHGVLSHYSQPDTSTRVAIVEPDVSPCLYYSIQKGDFELLGAKPPALLQGLDRPLPSHTSWDTLYKNTSACVTVSDCELHEAVKYLQQEGIYTGPSGAASLAALQRIAAEDRTKLGLDRDSVIVLFCLQGNKKYDIPRDIRIEDPVDLTQELVQINSANPGMGSIPGPGEGEIARYIISWLEHRDIETHWIEAAKGRPSIVGVVRGSGGGKSIMFNGHLDTVSLTTYESDPLSGEIQDGKLYGRGSADMKSGIAAAMIATANCKKLDLRGDVIFAGVADEEDGSIGTEQILKAGWTADAAIVNEPTDLDIVNAHRGVIWFEVNIHGVAYHGSRPDAGVDSIARAGHFLARLDQFAQQILVGPTHPQLGTPSVHTGSIKGGEEMSSYPAICTIGIEYRSVPGETVDSVKESILGLLKDVSYNVPGFRYDLRVTTYRPSLILPDDSPFALLVKSHVGKALGRSPAVASAPYWTDCALLCEAGIPSLLWGPIGDGLHSKTEWVDVESIKVNADGLTAIAEDFCK